MIFIIVSVPEIRSTKALPSWIKNYWQQNTVWHAVRRITTYLGIVYYQQS